VNISEDKMKKRVLAVSLVAGLVVVPAGQAAESNYLTEVSQSEWRGTGIGAVMGAVFGGPPGFVIGAAGGALFGRSRGLEAGLASAREDLSALQRQLALVEHQHQETEAALRNERRRREQRLDAIVSGFSLNIQFRTESAQLEQRYLQQLDRLAVALQTFPELDIHLDAFADERGSDPFNLALSRRRAEVVARQLQARGISSSRIHKVMHGERSREYDRSDLEGMGFDRRVLITFCRGERP
jgi:outer membrane protein OmpA-like peptidoglycan-associated protein